MTTVGATSFQSPGVPLCASPTTLFFEQIRGGEIPTYFSFIAIVLEFRYKIHPAYRGESTAFSCNGGEIRRLETREHKGVPPVKIRGKISKATPPKVHILYSFNKNLYRRGVDLFKNKCIAGLPQLPQQQKNHIHLN